MISQADIEQAEWAASQPPVKTLSMDALRAFLVSKGVRTEINIFHSDFHLPDPAWISGPFGSAWAVILNELHFDYQDGNQVCSDFAAFGRVWAHRLNGLKKNGDSLAFCEFYYLRDTGGGHAINAGVWRDESGALQLSFFEPQPTGKLGGFAVEAMQPMELSQCEIESCYYCRF